MSTNLLSSFGNKALRAAQAGFTMIELLVVIAVIGVLSVAVLSSINPIEQINKGRDTRAKSDAAQLINAVDRYFAIATEYPWNTENPNGTPPFDAVDGSTYIDEFVFEESDDSISAYTGGATVEDDWAWTQILVDNSEVKQGFTNRLTNDTNVHYFLYKDASANATMHACFFPSSNAIQAEAKQACDGTNDWPGDACPDTCIGADGDASTCMMCLP